MTTPTLSRLERENAELRERLRWRPIESAPRDVERCILWCADLYRGEPEGPKMGRIKDGTVYGEGMSGDWTFSHWLPLPEAPEASDGR